MPPFSLLMLSFFWIIILSQTKPFWLLEIKFSTISVGLTQESDFFPDIMYMEAYLCQKKKKK